jgi:hypothetical protein
MLTRFAMCCIIETDHNTATQIKTLKANDQSDYEVFCKEGEKTLKECFEFVVERLPKDRLDRLANKHWLDIIEDEMFTGLKRGETFNLFK